MQTPILSIILVNWNTRDLAAQAIDSLRLHEKSVPFEIIVVDNASSDGSADFLKSRYPEIQVLRNPENSGFARGNNLGVEAAVGRYVLLLNTDTVFTQEVFPACLAVAEAHAPAVVACKLMNADGSLQVSAAPFPRLGSQLREMFSSMRTVIARLSRPLKAASSPTRVDWLCGAFLWTERETYLRLGGLSEDIFMYGEDTEFCWRASKNNVTVWYVPRISIIHLGGGGTSHGTLRSLVLSDRGRLKAFAKMRGPVSASLMRGLFMGRSALRGLIFGAAGLILRDRAFREKSRIHFVEFTVLAGVRDARNFI